MPVDNLACGYALSALVAHDFVSDSMVRELLDPPRVSKVGEIGQDDDICHLADLPQCLDRAGHWRLAMHLAFEKLPEKRPYAVPSQRFSRSAVG